MRGLRKWMGVREVLDEGEVDIKGLFGGNRTILGLDISAYVVAHSDGGAVWVSPLQ